MAVKQYKLAVNSNLTCPYAIKNDQKFRASYIQDLYDIFEGRLVFEFLENNIFLSKKLLDKTTGGFPTVSAMLFLVAFCGIRGISTRTLNAWLNPENEHYQEGFAEAAETLKYLGVAKFHFNYITETGIFAKRKNLAGDKIFYSFLRLAYGYSLLEPRPVTVQQALPSNESPVTF